MTHSLGQGVAKLNTVVSRATILRVEFERIFSFIVIVGLRCNLKCILKLFFGRNGVSAARKEQALCDVQITTREERESGLTHCEHL